MKHCIGKHCIGAASALALLGLATTAQAAPLGSATGGLKATAEDSSSVDKVAHRRCWWRHGHQVCRWVGYSDYYDGGYYGYGPSVGFSFGGGRHHGGHRHHR
jgi:hypothetical protein